MASSSSVGKRAPHGTLQAIPPGGLTAGSSHNGQIHALPRRTMDPLGVTAAKRAAVAGGSESLRWAFGFVPATAIFNGVLNAPGIASNGTVTPPDSTGTIGPNYYIEMVNSQVAVYNRNALALLSQIDLDNFVGKPMDFQCDPQVEWDPQAVRFFYAALDCDGGTPNFLLLGWSKTASPLPLPSASSAGNWCRYQLNTGTQLDDYPKLGHNNTHMIIGTNVFDPSSFVTARIWAVTKPANGDASCGLPNEFSFGSAAAPLRTSDNDLAFTPVPANTLDGGVNGYVVAADFPGSVSKNQIMAWHLSGGGGTTSPTLTADGNITVSFYRVPANVPQPGTAFFLDSSDTRLTQAVAINDPGAAGAKGVWTQHTVHNAATGRSVVRWYELTPSLCSAGVCPATARRQQGTIGNATAFAFNGAISPTRNGQDAGIQYNLGGSALLPQIHVLTRKSSEPLNTMRGDRLLGTSVAFDRDFTCGGSSYYPCRWGDYAAMNPDPINTFAVWGTNMTVGPPSASNPHWQTRNFGISVARTVVSKSGGTISVTAGYGAANRIAVSLAAGVYTITDTGSTVTAGAGCTHVTDSKATCPAAGVVLLNISSFDANDVISNGTPTASSIAAGAGNDTITGGSGADTIDGGLGTDSIRGMDGNDKLLVRDSAADALINCDGGPAPGAADQVQKDAVDPAPIGCETTLP